jgi:phosphohistidine phosphatase SixA
MASRREFVAGAVAMLLGPAVRAEGEAPPWERLRRGRLVLLMRHASTTSEAGDPSGYRLDDCATQRNLSDAGRAQAKRVGEKLAAERIPIARVYTSPCCRETAMLAFGRAEEWAPLGSFFDVPDRESSYTASVKRRIASFLSRDPGGNVVMVTHNLNIAALTKLSVAPGEIVIVRPDGCCALKPVERLVV